MLTLNGLLDSSQSGIGSVYIQSEVVNLLLTEPTKLQFLFSKFLRQVLKL